MNAAGSEGVRHWICSPFATIADLCLTSSGRFGHHSIHQNRRIHLDVQGMDASMDPSLAEHNHYFVRVSLVSAWAAADDSSPTSCSMTLEQLKRGVDYLRT